MNRAVPPPRDRPGHAGAPAFERIVFYGRLGEQALAMFHLAQELPRWRGASLLDCPGGPGSLSARLRGEGMAVTAVDPLYALGMEELERRALDDLECSLAILSASAAMRADFDLQRCRREHLEALQAFLADRHRHPYAEALLAELPEGWQGRFAPSRYDQGHRGCRDALLLERIQR